MRDEDKIDTLQKLLDHTISSRQKQIDAYGPYSYGVIYCDGRIDALQYAVEILKQPQP